MVQFRAFNSCSGIPKRLDRGGMDYLMGWGITMCGGKWATLLNHNVGYLTNIRLHETK